MSTCPLTGKVCNEPSTFLISEEFGPDRMQNTSCCRNCASKFIDYRNKVAGYTQQQSTTQQQSPGIPPGIQSVMNMLGFSPISFEGPIPYISFYGDSISPESKGITPQSHADYYGGIDPKKKVCVCGTDLEMIANKKRLGCSKCYETFKEELDGVMPHLNGPPPHVGKSPKPKIAQISEENLIEILKETKDNAIKTEKYEIAQKITEYIKNLEENKKNP